MNKFFIIFHKRWDDGWMLTISVSLTILAAQTEIQITAKAQAVNSHVSVEMDTKDLFAIIVSVYIHC